MVLGVDNLSDDSNYYIIETESAWEIYNTDESLYCVASDIETVALINAVGEVSEDYTWAALQQLMPPAPDGEGGDPGDGGGDPGADGGAPDFHVYSFTGTDLEALGFTNVGMGEYAVSVDDMTNPPTVYFESSGYQSDHGVKAISKLG